MSRAARPESRRPARGKRVLARGGRMPAQEQCDPTWEQPVHPLKEWVSAQEK
jgi:hypothetical protein